ncbi:MAG: NAD(+)/NADH kinase [Oscillospiraceae bacterium]|nr:NAD(+)/NADH kinase [Oscillospiraceae bacterium]
MVIFIHLKTESTRSIERAGVLCERLRSQGVRCLASETNAALLGAYAEPADISSAQFDLLAAVGGDGTMLEASRLAIERDKPVFGVNAGRVGFLCAFEAEGIEELKLSDIYALKASRRAILEASLKPGEISYAVNEITLNKTDFSKTVEFETFYGSNSLGHYRADGIIVSTPTGSTGYSLSAGGPITDPELRAMVVTPICAHSLMSRSQVLAGAYPFRIIPAQRFANEMRVSIDGGAYGECDEENGLSVALSRRTLSLLANEKRSFYDVLFKQISQRR